MVCYEVSNRKNVYFVFKFCASKKATGFSVVSVLWLTCTTLKNSPMSEMTVADFSHNPTFAALFCWNNRPTVQHTVKFIHGFL